jgi:hypothetical protein
VKFTDAHVIDLPRGTLLFPSRHARESPGGGNYLCSERNAFMKDHQVFPAILLNPRNGTIVTPTGIHTIGTSATVSVLVG